MSPTNAGPAVVNAAASVLDVTRLRVALARLSRRMRRHQLAGLTPTQLAALSTVEQSGPIRLGDLAAAEGIAPSTLTRMVAVLEDLGYVRRDADPRDARASTMAITPSGHETLERLRAEGNAMLSEWLMLLRPEQRAAVAAALPALEALGDPDRLRTAASAGSASAGPASAGPASAGAAAPAAQNNSSVS